MKRPTQTDVARQAGVSRATVSYVLSGQANGRVPISQETRRRVLEAASQLGYEPDARAQSLRSGATKTIGLLIPDLHNPHFWQIVSGVMDAAHAAGYDLLLSSSDLKREQEENSLKSLSQRRIDGLILLVSFTALTEAQLEEMATRRLPIVMIGCKGLAFDCIGSNYSESGKVVMDHLLGLGHQRIGFIHGVASQRLAQDRLQPYVEGLREVGLPFDEDLIQHCGPSMEEGYNAATRLLSRSPRPTALIAINDLLALGAQRAAADLGLRIPDDLSLVGYDDVFCSSYLTPRLTTVHMDAEAIGNGAVALLLERLQDGERLHQSVELPTRLMIRESTGVAPVI
jgi:LacI family transcriptional regulator